jgi:rubrerythrin
MAVKRKPKVKDDKVRKKATKAPGKITLADYKKMSNHFGKMLNSMEEMSAEWSQWSTIKAKIDKKIAQLEKRAREPPTQPKPKVKWRCLSCGEVHEKRKAEHHCISCNSTNLEQAL